MSRLTGWRRLACGVLFLAVAGAAFAQASQKIKVTKESDLPRFLYPVKGTASELVAADDATFSAFASLVRADLDKIFRDYDIEDKATLRGLLATKMNMQELTKDYQGALDTATSFAALAEKPSAKLLAVLSPEARMQAALAVGNTATPAYTAAFQERYAAAVNALPWDIVQDSIKSSYAGAKVGSRSSVIGRIKTEIDAAVVKSGGLDNEEAYSIIGDRNYLVNILPLKQARIEVLRSYIAAHDVVKPDIWAAREVTLKPDDKLTPVLVSIWDSGIDVTLYPKQLFNDPHPTASGNHGWAFDGAGHVSKTWIDTLTPAQRKAYPEFRNDIKGFFDLENGIDSPEADTLQKKFATLTPEQMHARNDLDNALGHFIHGTHCAGIAVRGNPAARLVVARFNDDLPYLPFAPTTEWAERMKANFMAISEYFKSRHVRVVNMSWGDDVAEFEDWISRTGGGGSIDERKKKASELYAIWRSAVEGAIKNAPDTLFVTAAGNSDSDAGFLDDVPASLHLPNLIAVGAVNQAGDETSFTSSGDTVLVHANGYNVESFVPGGARVLLSGTSMASPNVVNLAAKLFALDPNLTPARVIELIRAGATTSDDGRRHLIDEKQSVALLEGKQN